MNYLRPAIVGPLALAALLVGVPAGHGAHISPTVVATVTVGDGPQAVGVNPATNRIYVVNHFDDSVSVIDGATNAVIATVPVGNQSISSGGIAVNPTTGRVYVTNFGDHTVSVIDGATNAIVATIPVSNRPMGVGVNPSTDRVYVANWGDGTVSVIDGASNAVVATIPAVGATGGVGVNPSTDRVYVASFSSDKVSVIDGATNAVIATIPVGSRPLRVGVNASTDRVYVGNVIDASVSVIDGATNAVIATVPVGDGPAGDRAPGVGVNPSTDRVYVANARSGLDSLSVIDGALAESDPANAVIATVPVGFNLHAVGVNPVTDRVYVADFLTSGTVSVIAGPPLGPIADPQGDTFGIGPVQLDISSIDAVFGSPLTVTVEFFTPIAPASADASNSVVGFIELDTDQNTGTGFPIDSVMGLEFVVDLFSEAGGFVDVFSIDASGNVALEGTAPIVFTPTSFTVTIPLPLLGDDDGRLNYLLLIGTFDEPTDLAPNDPPAISRPADTDADGVPDASDNCPAWYNPLQSLPPWPVTLDGSDPDCDGWSTSLENIIGTLPLVACAATPAEDDEPVDAAPPDFDDNQFVNIFDVNAMRPPIFNVLLGKNTDPPNPDYSARFDLNADDFVNIFDVNAMRPPIFNFLVPCTP